MIKTFVRSLIPQPVAARLPRPIKESILLFFRDFQATPPILVYQMGKVGSTTVYKSLQNAGLPNPVYHFHELMHEEIDKFTQILRGKIESNIAKVHWKVITLTREPVSREISDLFEQMERSSPDLIGGNGRVKRDQAIAYLLNKLGNYDESNDYVPTWFDKELKMVFGVDVYTYPFSFPDRFIVIHEGNVDVLILRMEDLTGSFDNAVTTFLGLERHIPMIRAREREKTKYSDDYRYVLENIVVPQSVCVKIYSTKYARHFYSEDERNRLIRKWSRGLEDRNEDGATVREDQEMWKW